ncbi:GDP-mannose 4,6-dehydratase [Candidatus Lokiarchaeum ossiferum]|uniref:GDP-mannose 4,6-dehydratase n=1 Tax=Candidatus Lokiarchaeum ossiferum TaxID=2951803 RepID=A0ABY6HX93_9ARCH|nr:GDP-mannose 4,6-dehydratase [Candidatus Lokiarchaeum sp. B-35]
MKALITGSEGFVGPYLVSLLQRKDFIVYGTDLVNEQRSTVDYYYRLDITDPVQINETLSKILPDIVFHLAGFSSASKSFQFPDICHNVNVEGTRNLLDAIVQTQKEDIKIIVISSAEVYGDPQTIPISESHPISAKNPYGESRILQEELCLKYVKNYNLKINIARSFNHTGPNQTDTFVISSFAKQIVQIENKRLQSLKVGNLDAIRDFSDVRDVVNAYFELSQLRTYGGIYNICSGKGYSIKYLLQILIDNAKCEIDVKQDPNRMRPSEIKELIGDNSRIKSISSWTPKYNIEDTLLDILKNFRVKNSSSKNF